MVERRDFRDWVARYEHAWREPGTQELAGLFATDATYRQSPWAEPLEGLDAIEGMWEREREGPGEEFEMAAEVVAFEGDTGVVRVEVAYGAPGGQRYRDLWVIELREDGRARSFEEWPFAPQDQAAGQE
jgi:nuclear transport factor 2 (NTF2) superfamily protein